MLSLINKSTVLFTAVWSAIVMGLTSGCASGGFKLTREYAGFVNKQNIVVRIILYILTLVVFAVTMLIDVVIFNTVDFWEGRVSQGTYNFNQEGKTYVVQHVIHPENGLRESKIEISGRGMVNTQKVILRETTQNDIEVLVDGVMKAKVSDISMLPKISLFDAKGKATETKPLWPAEQYATNQ